MGAVTKILSWVQSTPNSKGTQYEWLLGLVFILCVSYLWSTVIKQVVD